MNCFLLLNPSYPPIWSYHNQQVSNILFDVECVIATSRTTDSPSFSTLQTLRDRWVITRERVWPWLRHGSKNLNRKFFMHFEYRANDYSPLRKCGSIFNRFFYSDMTKQWAWKIMAFKTTSGSLGDSEKYSKWRRISSGSNNCSYYCKGKRTGNNQGSSYKNSRLKKINSARNPTP